MKFIRIQSARTSLFRYLTISLFFCLACAPALYLPTQEVAEKTGIPLENLKQGRQIYVDHCGSCHMLYLPQQFTAPEWRKSMKAMHAKVEFSGLEEKLMLDYLLVGKK